MLRYGFVPYRRDGKALVIVVRTPPTADDHELGCARPPVRVMVGARRRSSRFSEEQELTRVLDEATEEFQIQLLKEDDSGEDNRPSTADERHQPDLRLVDSMIYTAIQRRASDIHVGRRRTVHVKIGLTACCAGYAADRQALPQLDPLAQQVMGSGHRRKARPSGRSLQAARAVKTIDFRVSIMRARTAKTRSSASRQAIDSEKFTSFGSTSSVSQSSSCDGSASTSANHTAWYWSWPTQRQDDDAYAALAETNRSGQDHHD